MAQNNGRPTKYTREMAEKAEAYLVNYDDLGDPVPTVAALACELGVCRSTCYEWAKHHSRFSNILTRVEQIQERALVSGGLKADFNPAVTKMMLTKHGYSDKVEQDNTSSDRSMTPQPGIDASQLSDAALQELMNAKPSGENQ